MPGHYQPLPYGFLVICNENLELKILRCLLFSAFFCFWGTLFSPLHEFSSLKSVGYLLYYASLLLFFDKFLPVGPLLSKCWFGHVFLLVLSYRCMVITH